MRFKVMKLATLVVFGTSMLAITSSAGATVTPGGNVTGTATTDSFLRASSGTVDCVRSAFTATLVNNPVVISSNLQEQFSNCTLVGVGGANVVCVNTSTLSVTGATVAGVTPVRIDNLRCTITVTGLCSATKSGSVIGSFANATSVLAISATGQSLTISGSTCGALLPNGSATFTGPSGAGLIYTVLPRQVFRF